MQQQQQHFKERQLHIKNYNLMRSLYPELPASDMMKFYY